MSILKSSPGASTDAESGAIADDQTVARNSATRVKRTDGTTAPPFRLTRANAPEEARKRMPEAQRVQAERLITAMRQAMTLRGLSERALAAELGITLGSTHKYFTYQVLPGRVSTDVMARLARTLGVTVDALLRYFETGEMQTSVSWEDVESWLRSNASNEHLPRMFEALTAAAASGRIGTSAAAAPAEPKTREVYEWPIQTLKDAGLPDYLREGMGLTDEALKALAVDGVFDDRLIEAFSVATNIETRAVREAFEQRLPVPGY